MKTVILILMIFFLGFTQSLQAGSQKETTYTLKGRLINGFDELTPLCGIFAWATVIEFEIIEFSDSDYTLKSIPVIFPCPSPYNTKLFQVGEIYELILIEKNQAKFEWAMLGSKQDILNQYDLNKEYWFQDWKELKTQTKKQKFESNDKFDSLKIPDSLELITSKNLKGDFNGDNKTDFASMVENKINHKIGVLILHNSENSQSIVFGAGKAISKMTDLDWISVFKILPKGEIVSPTLVNEETGDIIGQDKSKSFKLIGDGIYMSVGESHGGGIIFWNGNEYQWYHIE